MPRVKGNYSHELPTTQCGEERANAQSHTHAREAALARALAIGLVVLSVGFRLPALVNASSVHSDAAIVGLQAMHILRGEWSPFLFGSGYQTSVDSAIAALFFFVAGPSPLVLVLSTLTGHVVLTLLAFAMLRRWTGAAGAFVLSLVLVLTPPSVHTYVLHPPRQASLTLAMAAFFVLDRAAARRRLPGFAIGGALASLACFADPYALVFLPGAAVLALMGATEGARAGSHGPTSSHAPPGGASRRVAGTRLIGAALGFAAGLLPLLWLWHTPGAKHGTTGLTTAVLEHNWRLFADTCLPWALSYQAWSEQAGHWAPWNAPALVRVVQLAGALVLAGGIASGALALRLRVVPAGARRLGLAGAVTSAVTVLGFLGSVMVMDPFSTRYLAAIVLAAPLALAPLAAVLRARVAALYLAPYLASAALCGWLGFVPWVDGARIVRTDDGTAKDELALERELFARGVTHAMADYWVSYRLTFLYTEQVVVVPKNLVEDRYAPYARAFDAAPIVAYVYDPDRSREAYESMPEQLRARGVSFDDGEWIRVGRLTALVVRRR